MIKTKQNKITFTAFQLRAFGTYSLLVFSPDFKLSTTFPGIYPLSAPFRGGCIHVCP